MKRIVTSLTVWNASAGKRISITYCEVDDKGKVLADNKRIDRVVLNRELIGMCDQLQSAAQELIEGEVGNG